MKKGFTLIELLSVIVILSIIGLISVIAIVNQIKIQDEERYNNFKETVLNATELYVEQNRQKFPELSTIGGSVTILVSELIEFDYIDEDLVNPKTDEKISNTIQIKITVLEDFMLKYEFID